MSLFRFLLSFFVLAGLAVALESAEAQDVKKKDMSGPVKGVITTVTAAQNGEGGSITIKTAAKKKDKDGTTNVLVTKDTKIEKGTTAKAGTGTPAKFSDLEKDVEVLVTMKEGMIGVADKVQILGMPKRKE